MNIEEKDMPSTPEDFEREAREYLEKNFAGAMASGSTSVGSVVTELARLFRRLADRGEDRGWNAALVEAASKTKNLSGFSLARYCVGNYVALEDIHRLKR